MKLITAIVGFFISSNAVACPNLLGTWQSSKDLSIAYNLKQETLTPQQFQFLNQVTGILKLTYSRYEIISHGAPTIEITIDGKVHPFVFKESSYKYEVLSCSGSAAHTKQYYPHGAPFKLKINFVDENTYWVSPQNLPSSREYFTRVSS